jgi:hypothetical protein
MKNVGFRNGGSIGIFGSYRIEFFASTTLERTGIKIFESPDLDLIVFI